MGLGISDKGIGDVAMHLNDSPSGEHRKTRLTSCSQLPSLRPCLIQFIGHSRIHVTGPCDRTRRGTCMATFPDGRFGAHASGLRFGVYYSTRTTSNYSQSGSVMPRRCLQRRSRIVPLKGLTSNTIGTISHDTSGRSLWGGGRKYGVKIRSGGTVLYGVC